MGTRSIVSVRTFVISAAALLLLSVGSAPVQAAVNAYLKIEGVKGDARDARHKDWIEVNSWSFGVVEQLNREAQEDRESSQPSVSELAARKAGGQHPLGATNARTGAVTGAATGRRRHEPIVITKEWGAASPQLFRACATGRHFAAVDIDVPSAGRMLHYHLTDVVVSSVQSSGGDRPTETITLNFTKIEAR